jgi:hypothetical protein
VRRRAFLGLSVVVAAAVLTFVPSASRAADDLQLRVLSNRADLISGGDALMEAVLAPGADAAGMRVDVDGRDVSSAFAPRADGRVIGLVSGLAVGPNVVTAHAGPAGARITLDNHPLAGPVFSGPHIEPWTCAGGAADADCNRPPSYAFKYMPEGGAGLQDYDPESPPPFPVAQTTTDQGKTVPYVVRVETGVIARDEYRIAVLFDPTKPWEPWAPQDGFNHKLVINHGASCDTGYAQGAAPDVLNDTALSRGFAVMSHALDNAGHNCNIITQAESLVMTKEYLVDHYGELRYTIGMGCSGGSLVQYQVANAYPGIYQGITPQCSFADAWSSSMQYIDYDMLRKYFEDPSKWNPGVAWTPADWGAVYGHPNPANPVTFTEVIPNSGDPSRSCPGVAAKDVFDENTNPKGVRCTLQDYMVNVFGRRPEDGYAQRPFDNTGIQYGLHAVKDGKISPAQFADLNAKMGGGDINYNPQPERIEADRPALGYLYRTGAINVTNNLDKVAMIDLRGPDPGAFHDAYRVYALRSRLDREFGQHQNHVIWRGFVPLLGGVQYVDNAILAMDQWLAAVEKDGRGVPLAQKLIEDRPADVADHCSDGLGVGADIPSDVCDQVVQIYDSPRIEAGMPFTDDVMKCQLKPLAAADYLPARFTDDEWAALHKAFPNGVCDYARPGVDVAKTVPWLTYEGGPGGRPLGDPPASIDAAGGARLTPASGGPAAQLAPAPAPAPAAGAADPEVLGTQTTSGGPSVLPRTGFLAVVAWLGAALLVAGAGLRRFRRRVAKLP